MNLVWDAQNRRWSEPRTMPKLEVPDHVIRLIQDVNMEVPVIKFLRNEYNLGLMEAKCLYDSVRDMPRPLQS